MGEGEGIDPADVDRFNKSDRSEFVRFAAFQFSSERAICISGKRTHISLQSRPLWRINRAVHLTFAEERERFFVLLVILAIAPSHEVKSSRRYIYIFFFENSRRILENNTLAWLYPLLILKKNWKLLFLFQDFRN